MPGRRGFCRGQQEKNSGKTGKAAVHVTRGEGKKSLGIKKAEERIGRKVREGEGFNRLKRGNKKRHRGGSKTPKKFHWVNTTPKVGQRKKQGFARGKESSGSGG